jgi:hypothetical protein
VRTLRFVAVVACALLPFAPTAAHAASGAAITFQVEPAAGSSTAPGGGYFVVAGTPGQAVTQALSVRNDSDSPLDLHLDAVDAATAQAGGTTFADGTETASSAGAWVALDRRSLTLGAKASATVGFTVTVPAGAASGVHLAGISATPAGGSGGNAGAAITVQSRRVIAVQVNLPGPAEPELVITGVTPSARPDGLYLELGIENRGRGFTTGKGVVSLIGDGFERPFDIETFVPGTSIAYPVKWTGTAPDGNHPARVEVRYGGSTAVWDGSFTLGAPAPIVAPSESRIPPAAPVAPKHRIPLAPVAGGIVAAGILLACGMALRRRPRAFAVAVAVALAAVVLLSDRARAAEPPVSLGAAASFAVVAGTAITSTGFSTVSGDLGAAAVTGFPPGLVSNGAVHAADAGAIAAQAAVATAYNDANSRACTANLTGQDLGGLTLTPGVYCFGSSAQMTGTLTLDAQGDSDAVFLLRTGSTLTTATGSRVVLVNQAQACKVFTQVGSSATLGTNTQLVGTVLAYTSITANAGTSVQGRLLASGGAVTMDTNAVSVPTCTVATTTVAPTTTTTVPATTTTTAAPTTTTTSTVPVTTTTTSVPGTLTITDPSASNFADRSTSGAQTTTATMDGFSVSDLTGTGGGWQVTVEATRFTGPNQVLPAGSLSMSPPTVFPAGPSAAAGPVVIDNGVAAQIARCEPGAGQGIYEFSATTLTLTVPAAIYAGLYSSSISLSVAAGP